MPNNPVQVILNTRDYFVSPDPGRLGPPKDFFADRDKEFVEHRDTLLRQVASIDTSFRQSGLSSGVLKVSLRKEAWAKSHRPHRALFPPDKRPCIGASKLGDLYYHVTLDDIGEVESEIAVAEAQTQRRLSKSGNEYVAPSDQRGDVGAVESISLPSAVDKRHFAVREAVEWLRDPRTSHAYFVELFSPPPLSLSKLVPEYYRTVLHDLKTATERAGLSVDTFPVDVPGGPDSRPSSVYGFRIVNSDALGSFNSSPEDHGRFLRLLDVHPYVRSVALPPILVEARLTTASVEQSNAITLPAKLPHRLYPKVGVIDSGLSSGFSEWIIGGHVILAPNDKAVEHGTFIAGLLVAGQQLNGAAICSELDGCELFDIGIFPDSRNPDLFTNYYPKAIPDFMVELSSAIEAAVRDHRIRIFNMSLNTVTPVQDDNYGIVATLLDNIADKHGVILVVSAGNLLPADCRPEWPGSVQAALQQLASRTIVETVLQPAESSRSISVGAVNPPGAGAGCVAGAPTAYTRRGPGLRVGVKPDVAHYGGAMPSGSLSSGLRSFGPDGSIIYGQGTSYAAPLVTKALASLDAAVESPLNRETLAAMLIHGSVVPPAIADTALFDIARQFVGFGIPSSAEQMLVTSDHKITMVFSDVLHSHRTLQFDFAWPQCLVNSQTGACRGDVQMTLVYHPPLNRNFGNEFVRANLDAHLRQEEQDGRFSSRLQQAFLPDSLEGQFEHELIQHGLKWWPTKVYRARFPKGIRDVVEQRLGRMLANNPTRMDYYRRYQEIIADYNREKDRVTIEQTFADLLALARSLDAEQRRAAEEGLNEEELALFDLLFKENISKAEREQLKQASKRLLVSLRALIDPMPHWTENASTQAEVQTSILDQLYRDLPRPPFTDQETDEIANRVYGYIWQRSASGESFQASG
ncbi:MAG TPA: S8 family serine peptidase [Terriglobales bacterium]